MKSALDIRKKVIGQVTKPVLKLVKSHWALRGLSTENRTFSDLGCPCHMGTIKRWHLSAAEKVGFLSFTRSRIGALEKWAVVTTTPGTGLISSGFRWLPMNELTRLLPHQQRRSTTSIQFCSPRSRHSSRKSWHQSAFLHTDKGSPRECRCYSLYRR